MKDSSAAEDALERFLNTIVPLTVLRVYFTPPFILVQAGYATAMQLVQVLSDSKSETTFIQKLASMFGNKEFRLRLVCNHCCKPQGSGYKIETTGPTLLKMIPLMKVCGAV